MFSKMFWTKKKPIPQRNIEEIKQICRILFVDDKKFPVVDILKRSGWVNTKSVKDLESLDQLDVKESHILFIDIQGVGRKLKFHDEGLGLIEALKEKYPQKKVIAYSAEDQGQVQAFHRGIDLADSRLSKTADPYQFQFLVEKFAKDSFSLQECVERIKSQIINELGRSYSSDQIIDNLERIYYKEDYSAENIAKIFNLQNAASVSSIVQLFLTA